MDIVTSLSKKELEQIIFDQVSKCLNDKLSPAQPEQSDRIGLEDACIIAGTPGKPLSKATIYKLTSLNEMPHGKFGNRLVFSRRQLASWVEARTRTPRKRETEMNLALAAAAKKHLRNGSK